MKVEHALDRDISFCGIRVYGYEGYTSSDPEALSIAVDGEGLPYIINKLGEIYKGDIDGTTW